jgi:flagellin-like hook-associated protein FlgL
LIQPTTYFITSALDMRLRLPLKTKKKLPIGEDQTPLKTKENLEEYLQSAISFLQTQQDALKSIISILEEVEQLAPTMKADIIRKITKEQENESKSKLKGLRKKLKSFVDLCFNNRPLFSSGESDTSFELFKGASKNAPRIKQPSAPHYFKPIQKSTTSVDVGAVQASLQAMQEMVGHNDAVAHDLQTSFTALASDPAAHEKFKFFEERVKTWVSEVIDGQDGLTVQANILRKRVDNLVNGLQEDPTD